jgi:hypothetical protein
VENSCLGDQENKKLPDPDEAGIDRYKTVARTVRVAGFGSGGTRAEFYRSASA